MSIEMYSNSFAVFMLIFSFFCINGMICYTFGLSFWEGALITVLLLLLYLVYQLFIKSWPSSTGGPYNGNNEER
jgi:Ca2+/Na+ antiporter